MIDAGGRHRLGCTEVLAFGRIGVLKGSILHSLVSVDKLAWQVLLTLGAFNIELLSHAVRVERGLAPGTFKSLVIQIQNLLADAYWLELRQEITRSVLF